MLYKKSLGQHFLIDKNISEKIVRLADISEEDIVWEIGSGKGILTEKLLKKCGKLYAFEIDKKWIDYLKENLSNPKLRLINQDILKIDFAKFVTQLRNYSNSIKIVANLPYQITSPIIFKIIESRQFFSSITIMIQNEVAERIIAKPRCKDYGKLSIKVQFYFEVKKLFKVPPYLFRPKPKVTSAVIQLIPKRQIPNVSDESLLWKIVDHTFQHRRKMLRTSLRIYLNKIDYQILMQNKDFDFSRRPEELGIEEFIFLTDIIKL
ncbi:MAG: ribosomal RNA small subunit methyltransferase A [Candidatus Cloacimonetes bacterium]|nr:ribosomal RNA small subunit methyltransferase A [Candidatus Cloacimonadota bacterium]MBL7086242.1 ribosomal RNA small subunit methyltransferase A [Candidatus Cloacimonadota bacterium]